VARTKILETLENQHCSATKIADKTSLSYNSVIHHLGLLEREGTIHRIGRRPYYWSLSGLGQKRLVT
jgi:predicted transcriptional regulator